jgi:hypothetical protein
MNGNAFEVVPAQDRSGFIRPLLPFTLVLFAYLLPTVWALWSVAALGSKQTIAGVPEYVAFSWFGFAIGAFAACVSIYIGYAYSKSGIAVRWQRASAIAAVLYLLAGLLFSFWLYAQFSSRVQGVAL